MSDLAHIVGWLVTQTPWLAVGVVGLVMVATRRSSLPGRAAALAVAGCTTVLAGVAAFMAWVGGIDRLFHRDLIPLEWFAYVNLSFGLLVTAVQAAGGGLLLAAALAGRQRPEPPRPPDVGLSAR